MKMFFKKRHEVTESIFIHFNMQIHEISDQENWNIFFEKKESPSFLQSWEWGELQKKQGYDILRLGIYIKKELADIALVIKIRSRRGNFLFIPHCIISETKHLKILHEYLIDIAKKENFSFIRIAPLLENTQDNQKKFADLKYINAPIYMHAERTWVLDLERSEEKLLNGMRKTTRYLIKRADRDEVIIEKRSDEKAFDDFWRIYKVTAEREQFVPYSLKYVKNEYEEFNKNNNALFLFGKVSQEYYASALILFTKSSGFYHQGASIHTKFPVTYRLQWEAIKEAKKRGCKIYNFWGILQKGRTPKDWGGLTLFKTGFGGRQVDYVTTQDFIISPKYYLTYLYELFLAKKRGV